MAMASDNGWGTAGGAGGIGGNYYYPGSYQSHQAFTSSINTYTAAYQQQLMNQYCGAPNYIPEHRNRRFSIVYLVVIRRKIFLQITGMGTKYERIKL